MSESPRETVLDRLLDQDEPVSPEKYQEYRMQLELALTNAVKWERYARWTTFGLWIAVLGNLFLVAFVTTVLRVPLYEWFGMIQTVLIVAAFVETIFYLTRYRPALSRARDNRQTELLRDLALQVAELSRRLDARQPPSAESPKQ